MIRASGDWPSGKAPGSGPVIGGSNPSSPATKKRVHLGSFFRDCDLRFEPQIFSRRSDRVRRSECGKIKRCVV